MPVVRPLNLFGTQFTPELFGANILATTDRLGEVGTYDDVIDTLGVPHVRYPGGSLAEQLFDLSDPNRTEGVPVSGGDPVGLLPYDTFMMWAEANEVEVTIVLPTFTQLGQDVDANGDRFADVDEGILRGFIRDTLSGKYGAPDIRAFEIGNEYSGSGGMSSVEYGRLASEMSVIVRDEIDRHPFSEIYAQTDVLIQMGDNFGSASLDETYAGLGLSGAQLAALEEDYGMEFPADTFLFSSGSVSWARVNSALIANEFTTAEEIGAVDGIVAHIYGRGLDEPNRWESDYRIIRDTMQDTFPNATKYVTEWNTRSVPYTSDDAEIYGLENAQEMLHMMLAMAEFDVEAAHVWPVQQNTANDLSGSEGMTDLTVAGEMFRMMSESLPGTHAVALEGSLPGSSGVITPESDYWLFSGTDASSVFVFADEGQGGQVTLDLSEVFRDPGAVRVERLGVQPGDDPAARNAQPDLEQIDPANVLSGLAVTVTLGPREIMHMRFETPVYTDSFATLLNGAEQTPEIVAAPEPEQLDVVIVDPTDAGPSGDSEDASFDIGSVLSGLMLLPLLMALG